MSQDPNLLKVKSDAANSALFTLYKATETAFTALSDLLNHLESTGFDTSDLRASLSGQIVSPGSNSLKTPTTPSTPSAAAPTSASQGEAEPETEAGDAQKTKKKRARDPNAPKRPLNSFLRFRNQEQKRIATERKEKGEQELSRDDMIALVRSNWENMSPNSREEIERASKADLGRYHEELALYKAKGTTEGEEGQAGEHASSQSDAEPATQDYSQEAATQESTQDPSTPTKRKSKKKDDKKKKKTKTE